MSKVGWRQLQELAEGGVISYGIVQPGNNVDTGIPIIRVKDVRNGLIDTSDPLRVDPGISARHGRTVLRGGELLLSLVGTVGEAAVVPAALKGWNVARAIAVIRPVGIEARWLRICFELPEVRDALNSLLNTTVQSTLNLADLKRIELPVPSSILREAILEVLGALDDKISANTNLGRTAIELARVIFEQAAQSALSKPISQILSPILGGTPARDNEDYWGAGNLWASARDVTGAPLGVILKTEEQITDLALSETRVTAMPKGSVILTARGTVGAVARLGCPSSFNQSCYGFISTDLPPATLYFSILWATDQAKSFAHGSVFSTITMNTFNHLMVPMFDPKQRGEVESKIAPLLEVVEHVVRENLSLATLRDTLLPALMSGELHVKDAEKQLEEVL